jgi:perosamine synthetase
MERISPLERKYVSEALDNEFRASKRNVFIRRLEAAFCGFVPTKFAIAHANGTCTLHTALAALGVGEGDEVIVPALTMSSPALAVLHNHSIPVFADADARTFTIDPASVLKLITPKTRAIISVSLYGQPPDYMQLLKICHDHKLFLIEDNALCPTAGISGRRAGTFGDFASYSFQGSKHLTSGEGGMLVTSNEVLAEKARSFSGLGFSGITAAGSLRKREEVQNPQFDRHLSLGFNYMMSELCAAQALAQLERVGEIVDQHKAVAALFLQAVEGCHFLTPQWVPPGYDNDFWSMAMILHTEKPETDWFRFRDLFKKNGGDGFYAAWKLSYNEPLFQHEIQYYDNIWQQYTPELCPAAEYLQPRLIQLKTNYRDLDQAEKQAVILKKTLSEFSL